VAAAELRKLGLSVPSASWGPAATGSSSGTANPFIASIRERCRIGSPTSAFPMLGGPRPRDAIDDLPGPHRQGLRTNRASSSPARLRGDHRRDPDRGCQPSSSPARLRFRRAIANAFGLLGKQLGAALEPWGARGAGPAQLRAARPGPEMGCPERRGPAAGGILRVRPLLELGGETLRRLLDADKCRTALPTCVSPRSVHVVRRDATLDLRRSRSP